MHSKFWCMVWNAQCAAVHSIRTAAVREVLSLVVNRLLSHKILHTNSHNNMLSHIYFLTHSNRVAGILCSGSKLLNLGAANYRTVTSNCAGLLLIESAIFSHNMPLITAYLMEICNRYPVDMHHAYFYALQRLKIAWKYPRWTKMIDSFDIWNHPFW